MLSSIWIQLDKAGDAVVPSNPRLAYYLSWTTGYVYRTVFYLK